VRRRRRSCALGFGIALSGLRNSRSLLLGSIAEFERQIMLERQREGIAKAKSEGKYKGRAPTARAKTDLVLERFERAKLVKRLPIVRITSRSTRVG
jgi:DNA invertase Pin-like site-specific DNA recombinase